MIPDIQELNFPDYATLSQATASLPDMAEKTITTQVKIDGNITPDFSRDWEIAFQGEKYIMPLRQPAGAKENTSFRASIDLTFQHWAIWQLKRWMFFTVQPVESGTAVADKYIASVSLNLGDFCDLFSQVLRYYFADTITIDLNKDWKYSPEPFGVEISYSHLWDVLIQFYDLYAVRWTIEPRSDNDNTRPGGERYVIRVGYPASEISHIFEYGFQGGLLKVERQIQDEKICNMLLGRGGEKNLPCRYFKDVDPDNPSFPADPDWIPELRNIYFTELRPKTFRDYIKGWKTNPRRQLTEDDGTPICPYGSETPISLSPYDPDYAKTSFAYELGHTDETFNPVEYVRDDGSIKRYGPLLDGLENNEEIYPSIQGVSVDGLGRIDQTVDIGEITSDDIVQGSDSAAEPSTIAGARGTAPKVPKNGGTAEIELAGPSFPIEEGKAGNFFPGEITLSATIKKTKTRLVATLKGGLGSKIGFEAVKETTSSELEHVELLSIESITGDVINDVTGETHIWTAIPAGSWRYRIKVKVKNNYDKKALDITASCESPKVISATPGPEWTNTWDIWVKNLWGSQRLTGESDTAYAERIWGPILGDRTGNQARIVFSDGWLSTSEDYEFVIAATPVPDSSHTIKEKDSDGNVIAEYPSHWRITLGRCDADLESTGLYLPSTKRQAQPGDHFFFIGIDMPHRYVLWAEESLDAYKTDELNKIKDIKPTFVVTTDRVRLNGGGSPDALIRQLRPGNSLRLADNRFVVTTDENGRMIPSSSETLYLQTVTYTFRGPTSEDAALNPDVELVLSDKYESIANPVAAIQGEISAISRQLGAISNVEQIVRAVGDKLYLRKDGLPDRSMSPTEFSSLLTSIGFRSGIVGGKGWGFFKDENGNWVLETDRLNVRQTMQVNTLVINQAEGRGGMEIDTAAFMEVTRVISTSEGLVCYFDQKNGSVANLFQVDDVAYCNRWTPENQSLKFYKRRVIAVGVDNITLTKGYAPVKLPDGTVDTGVNGSGLPEENDVIIHYGNYTNPERRYIKVRDVVGGGYERYIENLDSVNAEGTEFFFVGRQTGMYGDRPRWYIGDPQSNIEYREGRFNLNNVKLSVNSLVGDTTLGDVVSAAEGATVDTRILFIQQSAGTATSPALPVKKTDGSGVDYKGWSETAPQWTKGMNIWQTVMSVYGNGDVSFSAAVNISGRDGENGANYSPNLISSSYYNPDLLGARLTAAMEITGNDRYSTAGYAKRLQLETAPIMKPEWFAVSLWAKRIAGTGEFSIDINDHYAIKVSDITDNEWHYYEGIVIPRTYMGVHGFFDISIDGTNTVYQFSDIVVVPGQTPLKEWVPTAKEMVGKDGVGYSGNLLVGTAEFEGDAWVNLRNWTLTDERRNGNAVYSRNDAWSGIAQPLEIKADRWYTFSFDVKGIDTSRAIVYLTSSANIEDFEPSQISIDIDSKWHRESVAFKASVDTSARCRVEKTNNTGTLFVSSYKLEEGDNEATAWTPNSADLKGANGEAASMFSILPSVDNVTRSTDGSLSVSAVQCVKYLTVGNAPMAATGQNLLYARVDTDDAEGEWMLVAMAGAVSGIVHLDSKSSAVIFELRNDSGEVLDRKRIPVITDISDAEIGVRNLLLDSRGPFTTVVPDESSTDTPAYLQWVHTTVDLIQGATYAICAEADGVWTNDHDGSIQSAPNDNVVLWLFSVNNDQEYQVVSSSSTGSERGTVFTWNHPTSKAFVRINSYGKQKTFREIMLVKGNLIASGYTPAPEDFDYLREALRQSTNIEGGLVQTSLVELGYTDDYGNYHTQAGTSGLYSNSTRGGGIAFWAGGKQIDADDDPAQGATFAVRMNGTAYAARNTIRFKQNEIEVGDYVTLDADGLKLFNDKEHTDERLSIANTAVGNEADIFITDSIKINYSLSNLQLNVIGEHAGSIISPSRPFSTVSSRAVATPTSRGSVSIIGGKGTIAPIGKLTANSTIQVTVTCGFGWSFSTSNGVIDGYASGSLMVEIRRVNGSDREVIATYSGKFEAVSITRCTATIQINKRVEEGEYELYIYPLEWPILGSTETPKPISANVRASGEAKIGISKSTKLCSDGLVSVWDNSVLMVKDNLALLRVGGFGLKITSTGIKVIRNGTESDL